MARFKLTIEYDGSPYVGWQRQDNGPSVQQTIEKAVTAFCGETPRVFGAGRTDTGVHALGQVGHVDLQREAEASTVRDALNFHLKASPIVILAAEAVSDEFDARFSATGRSYVYRIINRYIPLTFEAGLAWHVRPDLDTEAMHRAAQQFVGRHDFTTFRASACQAKSPVKTLDRISVQRDGMNITVNVGARSFLHNQVRAMVGSLKMVGAGKWPEERIAEALAAADRKACGATAPACGLYLEAVVYDGPDAGLTSGK
jgi:tRNA pseudouridine38-40 synthase